MENTPLRRYVRFAFLCAVILFARRGIDAGLDLLVRLEQHLPPDAVGGPVVEIAAAEEERGSHPPAPRSLGEGGTPDAPPSRRSIRELFYAPAADETPTHRVAAEPPPSRYFSPRTADFAPPASGYDLAWPVAPHEGLSATFLDAAYRKRFGLQHYAVDIPVPQGTEVHAAGSAEVIEVRDRGIGYSTITLQHQGGLETIYGHVSMILVKEGDRVAAGDVIARSGGQTGTRGAGKLTTGPHLHFEVLAGGQPVNPLSSLPPIEIANRDALLNP